MLDNLIFCLNATLPIFFLIVIGIDRKSVV